MLASRDVRFYEQVIGPAGDGGSPSPELWESGNPAALAGFPSAASFPQLFTAEALLRRETSWGQIRREPRIHVRTLKQLLHFAVKGVDYTTDLYDGRVYLPLIRVSLIVQSMDCLWPGIYQYSSVKGVLSFEASIPGKSSFQSLYSLKNHNLDQVPVILIVVGRLQLATSRLGDRGVRVMNAEAGILAQHMYMGCTALSLGCGAALGLDAGQITKRIHLNNKVEVPLLMFFLGSRTESGFGFDFRVR